MSSKQNHIPIDSSNYEEFFILYMDNELSKEQMDMVDEFLIANPALQAEFDSFMSIKLPLEELSFNKEELLAENMKLSSVDEELFLYIDNELPSDRKQLIDQRLNSDSEYQLQHRILLQTRLDPSEIISYPHKTELYRRTERVIAFKPWMRIAAAVVVIAVSGILYFTNTSSDPVRVSPRVAQGKIKTRPEQKPARSKELSSETLPEREIASIPAAETSGRGQRKDRKKIQKDNEPLIVAIKQPEIKDDIVVIPDERQPVKTAVDLLPLSDRGQDTRSIASVIPNKVFINSGAVTSNSSERNNNRNTAEPDGPVARNDRKGSVKGFLRKATRLIEKRTGIDPTNEDGELLIGVVAVKLK